MLRKIEIRIPDADELARLGVEHWPLWEREPSTFAWRYEQDEHCYILDGKIRLEPIDGTPGESLELRKGDLVRFPSGLECVWHVREPVRKRYRLG